MIGSLDITDGNGKKVELRVERGRSKRSVRRRAGCGESMPEAEISGWVKEAHEFVCNLV